MAETAQRSGKRLRRVPEFAEEVDISVKTAWSWISQGRVGVVRLGRSVRIPQEEIERLIEDGFTPAKNAA